MSHACVLSLYTLNDNSILRDLSTHSPPAGKVSNACRSLMLNCHDIKLMVVNMKCGLIYKSAYYIFFFSLPTPFWHWAVSFPHSCVWDLSWICLGICECMLLEVTAIRYESWLVLLHQNVDLCTTYNIYILLPKLIVNRVMFITQNCIIITVFTYKCNGETWLFALYYITSSLSP